MDALRAIPVFVFVKKKTSEANRAMVIEIDEIKVSGTE
jgi:hypothetical protein